MVYRGFQARSSRDHTAQTGAYIDAVGFVLISLVVGLVIVPLIRLDAPVWLAIVVVAATIFAGNRLLKVIHTRAAS